MDHVVRNPHAQGAKGDEKGDKRIPGALIVDAAIARENQVKLGLVTDYA